AIAELAPFDLGVSRAIAWNDALAGDALTRNVAVGGAQHVALFAGWRDAARTEACVVELAPSARARTAVYPAARLLDHTPIRRGDADVRSRVGEDCSVHGAGRLYCRNTPGGALRAEPRNASPVVNHMRTNYSWFDCWDTGDHHAGSNSTWYHSIG